MRRPAHGFPTSRGLRGRSHERSQAGVRTSGVQEATTRQSAEHSDHRVELIGTVELGQESVEALGAFHELGHQPAQRVEAIGALQLLGHQALRRLRSVPDGSWWRVADEYEQLRRSTDRAGRARTSATKAVRAMHARWTCLHHQLGTRPGGHVR